MIKFNYDDKVSDNPAPVLEMEIRDVFGISSENTRMILDTGASMTCIPERLIKNLAKYIEGSVIVKDFEDKPTEKDTAIINIVFAGEEFNNVEVIRTSGTIGYLGRDVINLRKISLDHSNDVWTVD